MEKLTDIKIEKSVNRGFDFEIIFSDGEKQGVRFDEGDSKYRVANLLRYVANCLDQKNDQVSDGN
ncbi:MAG: hypothetical protein KKI15_07685 [Proteobacteria bacterium]|nr:hypothetical protein [Pseudomonadota bacterium]